MDVPEITRRLVSGKAGALARLSAHATVPPFVVLTCDRTLGTGLTSDLDDLAEELVSLLDDVPENLGATLAVRSSSSVEDSIDRSFAGLFQTELGVARGGLMRAVMEVMASMANPNVFAYCLRHGVDPASMSMNVIIQRMVDAQHSGVAFTRSPDGTDDVLIEVVHGLGPPLVDGRITPAEYRYGRTFGKVVSSYAGSQTSELRLRSHRPGTELTEIDALSTGIDVAQVESVARLALSVEELCFPGGADIEWAIERSSGDLQLLQGRPLTGM